MLVQKYFDERGQDECVSYIVVMGIGEFFDNYNNVLNFVCIINDDKGMVIGVCYIMVLILGLVYKICDFVNEGVQVNFVVFFYVFNNELCLSIMKINCVFLIEKFFAVIEYYIEIINCCVIFEYIMFNEVNDGVE